MEVLYERNNVAVHPRGAPGYLDFSRRVSALGAGPVSEISGRLALTRANGALHLSWSPTILTLAAPPPAPEAASTDEAAPADAGAPGTPSTSGATDDRRAADRDAYAVSNIPVADICALKRHTPTIGFHFVIVVLHSGESVFYCGSRPPTPRNSALRHGHSLTRALLPAGVALPPFYFHDGGVREFLAVLREHVNLNRSAGTPPPNLSELPLSEYTLTVHAAYCPGPARSGMTRAWLLVVEPCRIRRRSVRVSARRRNGPPRQESREA